VWVVDRRKELDLVREAIGWLAFAFEKDLQSDITSSASITRPIDDAHTARACAMQDLESVSDDVSGMHGL
jgi:hypothetical protein